MQQLGSSKHVFEVVNRPQLEPSRQTTSDPLRRPSLYTFPMFLSFFALWHVNKNLLVKAQKTWRVDSRDDELNKENEKLRKEFMSRWSQASSINRSACKALLSSFANWLRSSTQRPLKPSKNAGLQMKFEKRKEFVRAWTSEVRHFGNITTSRCGRWSSKAQGPPYQQQA